MFFNDLESPIERVPHMAYIDRLREFNNMYYNGSAAYDIPMWEEEQPKELDPRLKPKYKKGIQTAYHISAFAIIGYFAIVLTFILLLTVYVQYTAVSAEATEYQNHIQELKDEERILTIKYEQTFDMREVELYAKSQLGMDEPKKQQIGYISLNVEDKAIVYTTNEEDFNVFAGLYEVLISAADSFKK